MKCQSLSSENNKKNISECRLLKFLPSMLSVTIYKYRNLRLALRFMQINQGHCCLYTEPMKTAEGNDNEYPDNTVQVWAFYVCLLPFSKDTVHSPFSEFTVHSHFLMMQFIVPFLLHAVHSPFFQDVLHSPFSQHAVHHLKFFYGVVHSFLSHDAPRSLFYLCAIHSPFFSGCSLFCLFS